MIRAGEKDVSVQEIDCFDLPFVGFLSPLYLLVE